MPSHHSIPVVEDLPDHHHHHGVDNATVQEVEGEGDLGLHQLFINENSPGKHCPRVGLHQGPDHPGPHRHVEEEAQEAEEYQVTARHQHQRPEQRGPAAAQQYLPQTA